MNGNNDMNNGARRILRLLTSHEFVENKKKTVLQAFRRRGSRTPAPADASVYACSKTIVNSKRFRNDGRRLPSLFSSIPSKPNNFQK